MNPHASASPREKKDPKPNQPQTASAWARNPWKRALDIAGVLLFAPLCLSLCAGVAIAVRTVLGSPVFFIQERPGLGGRVFKLVKFRTMKSGDAPDAERMTRLGKFLRTTSLDELPEFWNILRGDMSFVGPRPLLVQYLPLYTPTQARRHEVRPGLSGWAQVHGRNLSSWGERFERDVWYVDHATFWLDARIVVMTLANVFRRRGIHAGGEATMREFTGDGERT